MMTGTVHARPDRRNPAPRPLRLVQAFVNSVDMEEENDALGDVGGLRAWIQAHGLPGADRPLDDSDRRRAIKLREALRDVLDGDLDVAGRAAARARLNAVADAVLLVVRFDALGGAGLAPAGRGVDAALAVILAAVASASADRTWSRLKVCRNDSCRWAFYDWSKNRSSVWCSMAVCGNRMKGRAYRRRRGSAGV